MNRTFEAVKMAFDIVMTVIGIACVIWALGTAALGFGLMAKDIFDWVKSKFKREERMTMEEYMMQELSSAL